MNGKSWVDELQRMDEEDASARSINPYMDGYTGTQPEKQQKEQ